MYESLHVAVKMYINYSFFYILAYMSQNYGNWLAVDKVIAKITRLAFLAHPVYRRWQVSTNLLLGYILLFTYLFFV